MKTLARITLLVSIMMMLSLLVKGALPLVIHYQVNVHMPKEKSFNTRNMYVVMTDGYNKPVAPPQLLSKGMETYHFFEGSSVKGTRIAQLIYSDGTTAAMFSIAGPDVQSGSFIAGATYIFNLYVTSAQQIKAED
ncbi:MAG: hypothetical protein NTU98_14760 [Bacteroidetes bacterium]|nr:hypothetical protein [Bacteroidota bacterium]